MKRNSFFMSLLTPFVLAISFTAVPSIGLAAWKLTGLTYHNWCPPAALRSGLCKSGEDFEASEYILPWSRTLQTYKTNRLYFDDGEAIMASDLKVPYLRSGRIAYKRYQLFANEVPCNLDFDQCQITFRGEAWEPASIPSNGVWRDVTMVFSCD